MQSEPTSNEQISLESGETVDPELGVRPRAPTLVATSTTTAFDTELAIRLRGDNNGRIPRRFFGSGTSTPISVALSDKLSSLVDAYAASDVASETRAEIQLARVEAQRSLGAEGTSDVLRSFKRAGLWTQFTILSGRSCKNLYRDPMLMLSHYAVSVIVAGASNG
jgi:hypothetical protein